MRDDSKVSEGANTKSGAITGSSPRKDCKRIVESFGIDSERMLRYLPSTDDPSERPRNRRNTRV